MTEIVQRRRRADAPERLSVRQAVPRAPRREGPARSRGRTWSDVIRLGFGEIASVGVRVSGDARQAAEVISPIDEIDDCVLTSGRCDLRLELVCRDDEHLLCVIDDRIRPTPGVVETETSICLYVHEQTYDDGTP